MEPRFGHDFSDVRIRIDRDAARAYQARAFTHGSSIVFDAGAYAPATAAGQHLLAHELAHVVQQGRRHASPGRLRVSTPSDRAEVEAARAADAAMSGRSYGRIAAGLRAAAPGIYRQGPVPSAPTSTPAPDNALDDTLKKEIISGGYADKGKYTLQTRKVKKTTQVPDTKKGKKATTEVETEVEVVDSTFDDETLRKAKRYLDTQWAPGVDVNKATGGSGDTKGKHIDMPEWVYEYQNKLAAQKPRDYVAKSWETTNNPNWNDDSFLAQRILEAFLRAWHRKELPDEKAIPSNLAELYKRAGVSEKAYGNAQATLLGDPNVYGWCGPATYNAVVLGLLKNKLRFKTGTGPVLPSTIEKRNKQQAQFIKNSIKWKNKDITDEELTTRYNAELSKMAFLEEVNTQAAFFIGNDTKKTKGWLKGDRFVTGDDAYANYALQPGDVITQALMNGSPVSGHVLTVVKEMRDPDFAGKAGTAVSTVYGISGNAGSIGGGSVKIEKFTREMPPASLKADLNAMSSLGNRMTVAVDERKTAETAERARLAKEQNVPVYKVSKEDVGKAADVRQAERRKALQSSLTEAEASFQKTAGMSYDGYNQARNAKNPPLNIIQIGSGNKDLIGQIVRLRSQIRAIDDLTNVPVEAAAKKVAYSTTDPMYTKKTDEGGGRFRPNETGNMWITTIIKASRYANAEKINAELNLSAEEKEKKIQEMHWDKGLSPDDYKKQILDTYGMEQLSGSVDSLWPGAIAAIEGEGLAKDYR